MQGLCGTRKCFTACCRALLCHGERIPILVRPQGCPPSSQADRCPVPHHLATREPEAAEQPVLPGQATKPVYPQAGAPRDSGGGLASQRDVSQRPDKDSPGKSWTNWHPQNAGTAAPQPQRPSRRRALRVTANFCRALLSNLLEVVARGLRRGQGQRGEAGLAAAGFAYLPEYLLMYPSPSPSHVWKRRRIRSSSPVLDVSLLLLPPPPLLPPRALPAAAAIMRPLPAPEEEDARPREESVSLKGCSQPRTSLTTEHAQWSPGAPGEGVHFSGFCRDWEDGRSAIPGVGTLGRGRKGRWLVLSGSQGWRPGHEGRQNTQGEPAKGVSSVPLAATRAPGTWARFRKRAGVLPAELFRRPGVVDSFFR